MYTPRYVSLTLTFPELPQFEFFCLQLFPNSRSISHNNGNGLLCTAQTLKCNWISHKRRTAVFTSYTQNSIPPRIFLRSPCLKPLRCVVLIDYHAHKAGITTPSVRKYKAVRTKNPRISEIRKSSIIFSSTQPKEEFPYPFFGVSLKVRGSRIFHLDGEKKRQTNFKENEIHES